MRHQATQTRLVADDAEMRAIRAAAVADEAGQVLSTGTVTLVLGTTPVPVALAGITARSTVALTLAAVNASTALGVLEADITPGVGFSVTSHEPGTPGVTQVGDLGTYRYAVLNAGF
jgi:hypothetical protein